MRPVYERLAWAAYAFKARCQESNFKENADMERAAGHPDLAALWDEMAATETEWVLQLKEMT